MGFLHPGEVSRRRTSLVGCWMLGLVMCSMEISCLNLNSAGSPKLGSELGWLMPDLGTYLKSHQEILDFNLRTSCGILPSENLLDVFAADLVDYQ